MTEASFSLLPDRGVLAVSGPDRRAFLQGLVSNDVEKLAAGRAVYAALLTAQGKYLHDFIMVEQDETIWLDAEAARLGDLRRRLSMYRLRAKVELAERPELAVVAAFGEGALAALGLPEEPGAVLVLAGGVAMTDPRLAALGARVILDRTHLGDFAAAGLSEANADNYDRHRLSLGVPDGSRDLVPDKSILLEAGFDELNGVSWDKGCYIGQELTARTKYRGLIKKRLFPVRLDGPAPPAGTIVLADGKDAGELRSSRDGRGLALLRLDAIGGGKPLVAESALVAPMRPHWMHIAGEDSPSPAMREREGPIA